MKWGLWQRGEGTGAREPDFRLKAETPNGLLRSRIAHHVSRPVPPVVPCYLNHRLDVLIGRAMDDGLGPLRGAGGGALVVELHGHAVEPAVEAEVLGGLGVGLPAGRVLVEVDVPEGLADVVFPTSATGVRPAAK